MFFLKGAQYGSTAWVISSIRVHQARVHKSRKLSTCKVQVEGPVANVCLFGRLKRQKFYICGRSRYEQIKVEEQKKKPQLKLKFFFQIWHQNSCLGFLRGDNYTCWDRILRITSTVDVLRDYQEKEVRNLPENDMIWESDTPQWGRPVSNKVKEAGTLRNKR